MSTATKEFIQNYYEEIGNKKKIDKLSEYLHKDLIYHGSPFIGTGFVADFEIEDKMVIQRIIPNTPAAKVLKPGDEIIKAVDDRKQWTTTKELMQSQWARGVPGKPIKLTILRDGEELDIEIKIALIEGLTFDYAQVLESEKYEIKNMPDAKYELLQILADGDKVACMVKFSGTDKTFDKYFSQIYMEMLELKDGKIVSARGVYDEYNRLLQLGYTMNEPEPQ
jgi:hypothetical protein